MDNNKAYRIVSCGKKSSRRDYSKVSGKLELPNLVEIQTDSFKWFTQQGIQEVFEEIYPIENYGKNIRLKNQNITQKNLCIENATLQHLYMQIWNWKLQTQKLGKL